MDLLSKFGVDSPNVSMISSNPAGVVVSIGVPFTTAVMGADHRIGL